MAAQRHLDARADTGLQRLPHRAGIVDRADRHVGDTGLEQRAQEIGRVVVAAAARIVGPLGQHQRPVAAGARRLDCLGDRTIGGGELVPPRPHLVDQRARRRSRRVLGAGLVADGDRGSGPRDVGPGEAHLDRDHVEARLLFEGFGARQQVAHDAGLRGATVIGALQHRGLHQQAARLLAALQCVLDQLRGLYRALVAVDMRIGAVAHQRVGVARHAFGCVGVQVERRHDRHVRSHDAAQRLQQRALGIVLGLAHHRAVQRQAHRIDVAVARGIEDAPADMLPRFARERARGNRVGRDPPYRRPAVQLRGIDEAAQLVPRAGEVRHDRLAFHETLAAIVLQRRRQFREGVGLVHELRDQDPARHGASSRPIASRRSRRPSPAR